MPKQLDLTAFESELTFESVHPMEEAGFCGFRSVEQIAADSSVLPSYSGIYFALYTDAKGEYQLDNPEFLPDGTGSRYKGRDPNVSLIKLQKEWVKDAFVLYIGKSINLKRRISNYVEFGSGRDFSDDYLNPSAFANDFIHFRHKPSFDGDVSHISNFERSQISSGNALAMSAHGQNSLSEFTNLVDSNPRYRSSRTFESNTIPHWGGRYIWQIKNARQFSLCWAFCDEKNIDEYEMYLQRKFLTYYGKLPFANLRIG